MDCNPRILVVDDESAVRFGIRHFLESHGFEVEEAPGCQAAKEAFSKSRPHALVLDYMLPDGDALRLMTELKQMDSNVPVVMLTAHGSIELAVRAIKEGADQFLTKPVELSALLVLLQREIENYRRRRKGMAQKWQAERSGIADPFIGTSELIKKLEEQAHKLLATTATVLLLGETGVGKGVLARWLHARGPRAEEPFVDLNCAGLSRELLESELFGHERGAFTGANRAKAGLLELGDRGTVFLDEIGDMDLQIQPKLLKVLEEKCFHRLGEVRDRRVDIRLIAATNHDLSLRVRERKFRCDLYYRINTMMLSIPSLRERRQDIPALAHRILEGLGRRLALSREAEAALQAYSWPGNIRELRNVLERSMLLCSADVLSVQDLRFEKGASMAAHVGDPGLPLADLERLHIERVLAAEEGHVERAAAKLGIPRSSLYDKLKRFNLAGSEA